eukprot:scaffold624_cov402-Prasinococcus_capsulatus_cf.AAC.58
MAGRSPSTQPTCGAIALRPIRGKAAVLQYLSGPRVVHPSASPLEGAFAKRAAGRVEGQKST